MVLHHLFVSLLQIIPLCWSTLGNKSDLEIRIKIVFLLLFNMQLVSIRLQANSVFSFSAALGQCAEDKMSLKVIHDLDGVRLLWSLLKNPSARVC